MAEACLSRCPRIRSAADSANHGISAGFAFKATGFLPQTWILDLIGHQRYMSWNGRLTNKIFPTAPPPPPIRGDAAVDLVRSCSASHLCAGPLPSSAERPRPFSRTRRAFGYRHTTQAEEHRCGLEDGPQRTSTSCIDVCPVVQQAMVVVNEKMLDVAGEEGLVDLFRTFTAERMEDKATGMVEKAWKLMDKELQDGAVRADHIKLTQRSVNAGKAMSKLLKVVKVANLAKTGIEAAEYLRAARGLIEINLRLQHSYECSGPTPTCPLITEWNPAPQPES